MLHRRVLLQMESLNGSSAFPGFSKTSSSSSSSDMSPSSSSSSSSSSPPSDTSSSSSSSSSPPSFVDPPPPSKSLSSPPPPDSSPPPPDSPSPPPPAPSKSSSPPPTKSSSPPPDTSSPPPASSPPASTSTPPPSPAATTAASPPPPADSSTPKSPPPAPATTPVTPTPVAPGVPAAATLTPPAPAAPGVAKSPPGTTPLFTPPPLTSTLTPPPDSSSSSDSSVSGGVIAAGIIGGLFFIILAVVVVCCIRKKRRQQYYDSPPSKKGEYYNGWNGTPKDHIVKMQPQNSWGSPPMSSEFSPGVNRQASPMNVGPNQSSFSYEQLAAATNGFSQENILGQGGFGYVHKGVLPNGTVVAVKSLKSGSGQGEREFQAEVEIISRVHHRHLVSLVGYCIADQQRMLVYEFVPNKTLEFHLYGKGQPVMDWATRMRIALGSAKGLGYLHEDCHPKIIHRDIKAANILLDDNFEAMVADFGLAKLSSDNNTHVSTRVMGTFGYLAPEYASSGKLTDKSDVFSFGVMLLELITGKKPVDHTNMSEDSLVDWARPLMGKALEEGNYIGLADPLLENQYNPEEMARMVACAAASIRHSAKRRPKMMQIVRALEGDSSLDELIDGPKPVHSPMTSSQGSSIGTSIYDTGAYNADIMKFRKMVMANDTEGGGDFGATSEYGRNPNS